MASRPASQPPAPKLPPRFFRKLLNDADGRSREFVVFVPRQYRASNARKWPVLIFLHGSGERGYNDLHATLVGLVPYIALKRLDDFPFISIVPQVSEMWFRGKQEEWIWKTLEAVQKEYNTDPDRVYLTGLSMGGFGAWDLAMHHPDRLAAILPICGGCKDPNLIVNLDGLPIRAFHGSLDQNVPVTMTRQLIEMLRSRKQTPLYTEFPDLPHNCWDRVYRNPEIYDWLLKQKRRDRPMLFTLRYPLGDVPLPWRVWWVQFDEVAGNARAPTMRIEARDDGTIVLASEAVARITLIADAMPIQRGKKISVNWNGRLVYEGPLDKEISMQSPAR